MATPLRAMHVGNITGVESQTSSAPHHHQWLRITLPSLSGTVLDVGAGTGTAATVLSPAAHWLALEPTPRSRLRAAVASRPRSQLLAARAEQLPLENASVDAVICSTVLCSVSNPALALSEIVRVLRPEGRFVFYEHVAADPGSPFRRLQKLASPMTRLLDHGCDPCRDTADTINQAGFSEVQLETLRFKGVLGKVAPVIWGHAVR